MCLPSSGLIMEYWRNLFWCFRDSTLLRLMHMLSYNIFHNKWKFHTGECMSLPAFLHTLRTNMYMHTCITYICSSFWKDLEPKSTNKKLPCILEIPYPHHSSWFTFKAYSKVITSLISYPSIEHKMEGCYLQAR